MFLKRQFNKETFKSYILVLLIISSLVQVGILWNFQNHGFPIGVFSGLFLKPTFDYKQALDEYFVPYRVILSSGDRDYKVLPDGLLRKKLWDDTANYLKLTASQKASQQLLKTADWGELAQKRIIMYEFKSPLPGDSINAFLGVQKTSGENLEAIYKIIVYPSGSIQSNALTVYINTGSNVYKYEFTFVKNGLSLKEYSDIFNIFNEPAAEDELQLSLIEDFDPSAKSFSEFSSDILCVMIPPKTKSYYQIEAILPDSLSNSIKVRDVILEDKKDNFEHTTDIYNTTVIKNLDSMYKIFLDGTIIYKNLGDNSKVARGDIDPALNKTLEFVSKVKKLLNNDIDIYISSISKNDKYFEFTFDYRIEGKPVYINLSRATSDEISTNHAFIIKTNSKGLLDCRCFLRNFKLGIEKKRFNVMLEDIFNYNDLSYTGFTQKVKDMEAGYFIKNDNSNSKMIWPSWSILLADGGIDEVKMPEGTGE